MFHFSDLRRTRFEVLMNFEGCDRKRYKYFTNIYINWCWGFCNRLL